VALPPAALSVERMRSVAKRWWRRHDLERVLADRQRAELVDRAL
jgi:hypothetical protein